MNITRGLIIADPWISHILTGRKDWEMRSRPTSVRGWFGLIRKGSGTVVGLARLVECGRALDQSEMLASTDRHCIPGDMIRRGEVANWNVPWKIADVIPLEEPIPYEHKAGAVTWVVFSSELGRRLACYVDHEATEPNSALRGPFRTVDQRAKISTAPAPEPKTDRRKPVHLPKTLTLPEDNGKEIGRSMLSGGNIRNNHMKLGAFLHAFPQDVIGGSNKSDAAPRQLEIDWGGPETVRTDVDGTKSIFRARGWVRRLFAASGAKEGDSVVVSQIGPYKINVRIEPGQPTI